MSIACLLPAAGASSRMRGGDKLLEEVDGKPCLETMAERALAAGLQVIATLPSLDHPRADAIKHLPLRIVFVPDAALGMSRSLVAGVQAMPPDTQGLMILPPDMPEITRNDIAEMVQRFEAEKPLILRARTASGKLGHPIIFSKKLTGEFAALSGDKGAQSIVRRHKEFAEFVDFDDERPLLDLDTPEAWADWRASLGRE